MDNKDSRLPWLQPANLEFRLLSDLERNLTEQDQREIQKILLSPLFKKYMNHLIIAKLIEQAEINIEDFIKDREASNLRAAFIKGGLSILYTLATVEQEI